MQDYTCAQVIAIELRIEASLQRALLRRMVAAEAEQRLILCLCRTGAEQRQQAADGEKRGTAKAHGNLRCRYLKMKIPEDEDT
jgi:hypothetical protein